MTDISYDEALDTVLTVVADETGYPVDALDPDSDLETDLGVDSIKRVQIQSRLREAFPSAPEPSAADLTAARTPAAIAGLIVGKAGPAQD